MNYMDQYRKLTQFTNVREFDRHRSQLFYSVKDKLSKGALAVWNVLAQHACDVPGVCWLKIDNIAKLADVSRSTVERAIRLFKKLGAIRIEETTRPKNGGDGANVYIFQKLGEGAEMTGRPSSGKPCDSKIEPDNSGHKAKISKAKPKALNKRTAKPAWIPDEFYDLLAAHFNSDKEIEEYWRAVYASTYRNTFMATQDRINIGIEAFLQMKTKRRTLRKPIAYFTGTVKRMATQRYFTDAFISSFDALPC